MIRVEQLMQRNAKTLSVVLGSMGRQRGGTKLAVALRIIHAGGALGFGTPVVPKALSD